MTPEEDLFYQLFGFIPAEHALLMAEDGKLPAQLTLAMRPSRSSPHRIHAALVAVSDNGDSFFLHQPYQLDLN